MTLEQLCAALREVQQGDLAHAPADQHSAPRVVAVPSSQSMTQQSLVQALGIDRQFPVSAAK